LGGSVGSPGKRKTGIPARCAYGKKGKRSKKLRKRVKREYNEKGRGRDLGG